MLVNRVDTSNPDWPVSQ
nr:hypothetical protein [Salmonella bongori]